MKKIHFLSILLSVMVAMMISCSSNSAKDDKEKEDCSPTERIEALTSRIEGNAGKMSSSEWEDVMKELLEIFNDLAESNPDEETYWQFNEAIEMFGNVIRNNTDNSVRKMANKASVTAKESLSDDRREALHQKLFDLINKYKKSERGPFEELVRDWHI